MERGSDLIPAIGLGTAAGGTVLSRVAKPALGKGGGIGGMAARVYEEEREFISQALEAGTDGAQAEALGEEAARYVGRAYGVSLSSGTAAMHLALKLAAEKLYGSASGISTPWGLGKGGALYGRRVFCPDFAALESVAPVIYEGGEPVFIDCGSGWGMDPEVLELAFGKYPDVRIVVMAHPYGYLGNALEVLRVCRKYGALLIEECFDALGAEVCEGDGWRKAGSFGDYAVLDFGPGRIITGGGGGALLTDERYEAEKARYWACGAHVRAPWEQHEELGYDYRMCELSAAAARGQFRHLGGILDRQRAIHERYREGLGELAVMVPGWEGTSPNFWISCMECAPGFAEARDGRGYAYAGRHGASAPMEICEALRGESGEWECRPVHRPLSMQPLFLGHEAVTLDGCRREYGHFYEDDRRVRCHMAAYYFDSAVCLPSCVGLEKQERIIETIHACYSRRY